MVTCVLRLKNWYFRKLQKYAQQPPEDMEAWRHSYLMGVNEANPVQAEVPVIGIILGRKEGQNDVDVRYDEIPAILAITFSYLFTVQLRCH